MKRSLFWLLIIFSITTTNAQTTRYIIQLVNKANNPYSFSNPIEYLSQRSIDRRTRFSLAIDSTDLPVTPSYLESIRSVSNVTILNVSKWLNQVSIQTNDANALNTINNFPFVQSVSQIAARSVRNDSNIFYNSHTNNKRPSGAQHLLNVTADFYNYGNAFGQIHIHNGEFLHNIGLRGQNMIIGMLDVGYYNYTSLKAFDSINTNGQVLGTWDFVAREQSVVEDDSHGMQCFSVIAANIPGQFVGTAPKANFYLFRSEDVASEYPIEEHNWVCAAERLDSAGGDVISSSLGYNVFDNPSFNHTYGDLNGNTTIAAKGADLAAKKGILVVNAAGNAGNSSWKYILTPADADSILAVGAVNINGQVGNFSSYGPSSDGQVKPDVAAVGVGTIVQYTNNTIGPGNGTSFACPSIAGLATCLWQGFPEFNNMKIINTLRQASHNYSTPNDRIGYGIPDVKKALVNLLKEYATASATINNCKTSITWNSKDVADMKYEIERKIPGETSYTKIGERSGSGNIFSAHSYQFADSLINVQSGTISYRIRQIVDAATSTADYIDTVNVVLNTSCTTTGNDKIIQIIPNPVPHSFVLRMTDPSAIQNLKIIIINSIGQTVAIERKSKPNGTANFMIPISYLAKGKYIVMVYDDEKLLYTEELIRL